MLQWANQQIGKWISEQFLEEANCQAKLNWEQNIETNLEELIRGYKGVLQDNIIFQETKPLCSHFCLKSLSLLRFSS